MTPIEMIDRAPAPTVRLAHTPGAQGDNCLTGSKGVAKLGPDSAPALLVSFVYLKPFLRHQKHYMYRDWALDSGAFSAHMSGDDIDLDEYIDTCRHLMATDKTLTEIFALDVIGDWKAGLKNCEKMWAKGIPAIPAYHIGEPWDVLAGIAKDYPKIALGGVARMRAGVKKVWAGQCFARVWPKRIHGFGFAQEDVVMAYPWHSVDATNWELGPCAFGRWNTYGKLSVRGSHQNLRVEVEWYLKLEAKARWRWRQQMASLGSGPTGPSIRMAVSGGVDTATQKRHEWMWKDPTIRLAMSRTVPVGGDEGKRKSRLKTLGRKSND